MGKHKSTIDWKSKFLDLLIVIIGITIAFKLNTWNESIKEHSELEIYLQSFQEETALNIEDPIKPQPTINNLLNIFKN